MTRDEPFILHPHRPRSKMPAMRPIVRTSSAVLLFVVALVAIPARAQRTALGEMPQPSREGNALRFQNAQGVAV